MAKHVLARFQVALNFFDLKDPNGSEMVIVA